MHRDPWFSWYRGAFFVSAILYGLLLLYATLGRPLVGWLGTFTERWFSLESVVTRVQIGAWSLMLLSGAVILACLVVRAVEWFDARDRERSSL